MADNNHEIKGRNGALMAKRTIVKIDEKLCNGCGVCISPCAEGALKLVNGKARVIKEEMCDGAGFCLGVCPTGALSLETREAPDFSEAEVKKRQQDKDESNYIAQTCNWCGTTEKDAYLLAVKREGRALWICSHCLPRIIHG
ncbi:MAG TPA: 4Fe-4S dicluster domain-containing protein [Syntrophomonadaceae bacterium]|nr:4Fe-4S dicluster domain-containing protein [Syntrophomonadaceae bacterium]